MAFRLLTALLFFFYTSRVPTDMGKLSIEGNFTMVFYKFGRYDENLNIESVFFKLCYKIFIFILRKL